MYSYCQTMITHWHHFVWYNGVRNKTFHWKCINSNCSFFFFFLIDAWTVPLIGWHLKILTENSCRKSWYLYTLITKYFHRDEKSFQTVFSEFFFFQNSFTWARFESLSVNAIKLFLSVTYFYTLKKHKRNNECIISSSIWVIKQMPGQMEGNSI